MRNIKAEMFNRKASDPKSRPDQIIDALSLQCGQFIADIGAGGGYFSLRFTEAVGKKGKVYAVDTDPEFLRFVEWSAKEKGLNNIQALHAKDDEPRLPEKALDLIFMRNVTHHLRNRVEYFRKIKSSLKPGGRIAIIEYSGGRLFSFLGWFRHYIPRETILKEMDEAGYWLVESHGFLPEQSFLIFSLKPDCIGR